MRGDVLPVSQRVLFIHRRQESDDGQGRGVVAVGGSAEGHGVLAVPTTAVGFNQHNTTTDTATGADVASTASTTNVVASATVATATATADAATTAAAAIEATATDVAAATRTTVIAICRWSYHHFDVCWTLLDTKQVDKAI